MAVLKQFFPEIFPKSGKWLQMWSIIHGAAIWRTEVLSEKQFAEYTKEGYPTTVKTWRTEKGHWTGVFNQKLPDCLPLRLVQKDENCYAFSEEKSGVRIWKLGNVCSS